MGFLQVRTGVRVSGEISLPEHTVAVSDYVEKRIKLTPQDTASDDLCPFVSAMQSKHSRKSQVRYTWFTAQMLVNLLPLST